MDDHESPSFIENPEQEARVALTDLFERLDSIALSSDELWEPRQALHVHGPARLPIRFTPAARELSVAEDSFMR